MSYPLRKLAMHLTLRQLSVFEAVARHQSFTRAAAELHLSQPAVSMQIRQLQLDLGVTLFELINKRIYLTDAGKVIRKLAREVAVELRTAEEEIEGLRGQENGRLRVGVTTTVNYFASGLLAQFCRTQHGVRVTLDVTDRNSLVTQLMENAVDIVLMGQPPAELDVEAIAFKDNPLVVIAPSSHRQALSKQIPLSALSTETFLMRAPGSGTRVSVDQFFKRQRFAPASTIEMSSNEAIKHSVEVGLGIGVVSLHTVQPEIEAKRLLVLDVCHFPLRRRWYCVHRRGKKLSPAARAFKASVLGEGMMAMS